MLTGNELLEMSTAIAPYLKSFIGKDMMVVITDRERILAYTPGKAIDDPCEIGELIPADEPMLEAMAKGRHYSVNVPKEVYGFAFKSTMTPIFDKTGKVVGCVAVGTSMEVEDEVINMSAGLLSALQQVSAAIQEIAASAAEISASEKQLVGLVELVDEASTKINQVLGFIKSVADQTKLLGLNASIEAARAGEAGWGFSVVAKEIRKLSDDSNKTVEQVRKLTEDIQKHVKETIGASQKTLQASEEQVAATQEVTASVEELTEMANRLEGIVEKL